MNWIKRNAVVAFFVLAYAVAWSFEIPLALAHFGLIRAQIPTWLHYCAALGPLSAALIMTCLTAGAAGLRRLAARVFQWRIDLRYYAFTMLAPAGLFALACVLNRVFTGS
ncbi:MAG: hypothetical protein GYA17_15675, partial [Chloroflexi bacterium]|nr:hypothetical protein [Chloroflexota bacterium]